MKRTAEIPEDGVGEEYVKTFNIERLLFCFNPQLWEGRPIRSSAQRAFGLNWYMTLECEDDKLNHYKLILKCNEGTFSNVWEFSCSMELEMVEPGNQKVVKIEKKFDSNNNSVKIPDFLEYDPINSPISSVSVLLRITMNELVGLPKEVIFDFENKHKITSDATILVFDEYEEKEKVLHVSKSLLSLYSPVFREKFIKLEKKQKPAEIKLRYDYDAVVILLNLIYPSHCLPEEWYTSGTSESEEVGTVLAMAEKYKIDFALRKLEKFLIKNFYMSLICRFHFAEVHKLDRLMNHCLAEIKSVNDAERAIRDEDYADMVLSNKTKSAILERLLSLAPTRRAGSNSGDSEDD